MKDRVLGLACDASTLILLAKVDSLPDVTRGSRIVVTDVVYRECSVADTMDSHAIQNLKGKGEIEVVEMRGYNTLIRGFKIAPGEASTIALALKRKLVVATDDRRAIRTCKLLRLRFATAIHIILMIYNDRLCAPEIARVRIEKLGSFGWYNEKIIKQALRCIREV